MSADIHRMSAVLLKAVISREPENSVIKGERMRAKRAEERNQDKAIHSFEAHGTGMKFIRSKNMWIVASLSQFGRASLSGKVSFLKNQSLMMHD
jgi:hypothetical protein